MKWHLGTKTTSFGVRKCRWHLVSQGTQTPVSWMKVVFATPYPTFIILVTFLLCKLRCLVQLLLSSVTESVCVFIGGAFKPGGFYPHVRKWRYLTPWEETGLLFSCFSAMGTAIFFKLAQQTGWQLIWCVQDWYCRLYTTLCHNLRGSCPLLINRCWRRVLKNKAFIEWDFVGVMVGCGLCAVCPFSPHALLPFCPGILHIGSSMRCIWPGKV